jgi:hypothetical protein
MQKKVRQPNWLSDLTFTRSIAPTALRHPAQREAVRAPGCRELRPLAVPEHLLHACRARDGVAVPRRRHDDLVPSGRVLESAVYVAAAHRESAGSVIREGISRAVSAARRSDGDVRHVCSGRARGGDANLERRDVRRDVVAAIRRGRIVHR